MSKEKQIGLIYNIPCRDCNACYISQTRRNLTTRVRERRRNYMEDPSKHTVLTKHMLEFDHRFEFERAKIIGKGRFLKNKIIHETFEIIRYRNSINLRYEKPNIYEFYTSLLDN